MAQFGLKCLDILLFPEKRMTLLVLSKFLQDGAKDSSPWLSIDGGMIQKVKDEYANSIIVRTIFPHLCPL